MTASQDSMVPSLRTCLYSLLIGAAQVNSQYTSPEVYPSRKPHSSPFVYVEAYPELTDFL